MRAQVSNSTVIIIALFKHPIQIFSHSAPSSKTDLHILAKSILKQNCNLRFPLELDIFLAPSGISRWLFK